MRSRSGAGGPGAPARWRRPCGSWRGVLAPQPAPPRLGQIFRGHAGSASLAGTYFTHEAKGADDAADADTAIINAEGGQNNSEEKKEYFI